jgi:hypothetical protein
MASFISESDSNLFSGEEIIQHHFFFSLTMDMNRNSQHPLARVPVSKGVWHGAFASGVRVHNFFDSGCLSIIPFRLHWQSMDTLKEGEPWQMWEFIPIF